MSGPGETATRTVEAEITYLSAGSYVNRRFVAPGAEVNTGRYEPCRVQIHDARPFAEQFNLDEHGFVLARRPSAVRDFFDRDEVEARFEEEALTIVRDLTGADLVTGRGWMIRTSGDLEARVRKVANYRHRGGVQPPAAEAHVDFSPALAERMARQIYTEAFPGAEPYRRFISSSLWRAFSPPPQDWPLALCEANTVGRGEGVTNALVIVDEIPDEATMRGPLPDEENAITASIFHYNPAHRWWYFPNMTREEVLLFKFHDSDPAKALRVPHTAFRDSSFPAARPRQSIEFRSFAFFL